MSSLWGQVRLQRARAGQHRLLRPLHVQDPHHRPGQGQLQLLLAKEQENITLYWQLEELQQFVADMELNAHNLNYNQGDQDNCW